MMNSQKITVWLLLAAKVILITIGVVFASHAIAQTVEQICYYKTTPV